MTLAGRFLSAYDRWLNARVYRLAASVRSVGPLSDHPEIDPADAEWDEPETAVEPEVAAAAAEGESDGSDDYFPSGRVTMDELRDRWFGPVGSPERAEVDRLTEAYRRRSDMAQRLSAPLLIAFGRPVWYDGRGNAHSVGHVAYCWWHDLLMDGSVYGALDGLAFHYFDDAYVMPLRRGLEIIGRKAGRTVGVRRGNWRPTASRPRARAAPGPGLR